MVRYSSFGASAGAGKNHTIDFQAIFCFSEPKLIANRQNHMGKRLTRRMEATMNSSRCWCGYSFTRKPGPVQYRIEGCKDSFQGMLDYARCFPFDAFERYPYREVRIACLEAMRQWMKLKKLEEPDCHWFVDCIIDLIEQGDDMFRELLALYVNWTKKRELSSKAVEFTIFLWDAGKIINANWVSKNITPKLLSFGHEYSCINGLKFFLQELLNFYWRRGGGFRETTYRDDTWTCIERALQVIAKNGDYEFLPDIEALISFMEKGVIGPEEKNVPRWIYGAKEMHLALLKAVRDLLKEKKAGDMFAKESKRINCPYCLRYEGAGAKEHHPFCPTIAKNPKQTMKDFRRGWKAYEKGVKRENLDLDNAANPHFMVGYNAAYLCDDETKPYFGVEDLHISKVKDYRK